MGAGVESISTSPTFDRTPLSFPEAFGIESNTAIRTIGTLSDAETKPPAPGQPAWMGWLLLAGLWTAIGLSFAIQFYLSSSKAGWPITWWQALRSSLSDWYVFALLSVPTIHLCRRFRLERGALGRNTLIHAGFSLLFSMAYIVLRAAIASLPGDLASQPTSFAKAFEPLLLKTFHYNLWVYWVIVAVRHAFDYNRRLHERELRNSELETRLARAKLQALQMQLNPHFLFNTLHTVSALMHQDVERADKMIAKLSDLLRQALDKSETHLVPLREEIGFLKKYLEIEQTRFGDRLQVQIEIPEALMGAMVPNLLLQPVVENAIRHGIEPHARQGSVRLTAATRADGRLELTVADNGGGLPKQKSARQGIGVANTRARLEQLYGANQEFALDNAPGGGVSAKIVLPLEPGQDQPG